MEVFDIHVLPYSSFTCEYHSNGASWQHSFDKKTHKLEVCSDQPSSGFQAYSSTSWALALQRKEWLLRIQLCVTYAPALSHDGKECVLPAPSHLPSQHALRKLHFFSSDSLTIHGHHYNHCSCKKLLVRRTPHRTMILSCFLTMDGDQRCCRTGSRKACSCPQLTRNRNQGQPQALHPTQSSFPVNH